MAKISIKRMTRKIQLAAFGVMGSLLCAKAADAVPSPQAAEASMGFFGRAHQGASTTPGFFGGMLIGAVLGVAWDWAFGDPKNVEGPKAAAFRGAVFGVLSVAISRVIELG